MLTYEQLLDYFWRHIDPTVKDRQFCDVSDQYRSAIFYGNDEEKAAALASKTALEKSGKFAQIHTEIAPKSITRITTKQTRFDTNSIAPPVAANPESQRYRVHTRSYRTARPANSNDSSPPVVELHFCPPHLIVEDCAMPYVPRLF
jgi:hypothetical protein